MALEVQDDSGQVQVYERGDRDADLCQAVVFRSTDSNSAGQHDIPATETLTVKDLERIAACTDWKGPQPAIEVFDGSLLQQPVRYISGKLRTSNVKIRVRFSDGRVLEPDARRTTFLLIFRTGKPDRIVGSIDRKGPRFACKLSWPDPVIPFALCP